VPKANGARVFFPGALNQRQLLNLFAGVGVPSKIFEWKFPEIDCILQSLEAADANSQAWVA
jgi:hypothetical protein